MKIPKQYRNANAHPEPMSAAGLIAPNKQSEVQRTINEHPEINTMDEEARGEIIDITDWRVNHDLETPWGRKARNNDPNNPNLNTDGMTFQRSDGLFEIYDCISGIDGQSSWEGYGPYAPGENGYWWPPQPTENSGGGDSGGGGGSDLTELETRMTALETSVATLADNLDGLTESVMAIDTRLVKIENAIGQGLHCHGPIDVPIVLESLTRLRAKGDINVAVTVGQAVPPPEYEGGSPSLVDVLLLKRILNRNDSPES
jgi:hypothetical protein